MPEKAFLVSLRQGLLSQTLDLQKIIQIEAEKLQSGSNALNEIEET